MITVDGQPVFVIDGHVHFWDGSPANWRNQWGEGWIKCFYDYHTALTPKEAQWSFDQFCKYPAEQMVRDLFLEGHVDMAIFNSTYLKEFFTNGFNTHEQNYVLKQRYPDRFILCGSFDPRWGEAGFETFRRMVETYPIQGLKLYTAEWYNGSRGWRLTDPMAYRYLELCRDLGIKNIHVHKGPTVYPLSKDAFDVHDVDTAATDFPELNFIVEHVGLPRLDDFCWIAKQDRNIYAGLAVASAFIALRPRYFAEIMANLLYWVGEDRILFGSDYAIWTPKWILERFVHFTLPEDIRAEYGVDLTPAAKRKILGENAARLYGIDIAAQQVKLQQDPIGQQLAATA